MVSTTKKSSKSKPSGLPKSKAWFHNSLMGYAARIETTSRMIAASETVTGHGRHLAGEIERFAIALRKELKTRIDK